jgi:hypothetical protein
MGYTKVIRVCAAALAGVVVCGSSVHAQTSTVQSYQISATTIDYAGATYAPSTLQSIGFTFGATRGKWSLSSGMPTNPGDLLVDVSSVVAQPIVKACFDAINAKLIGQKLDLAAGRTPRPFHMSVQARIRSNTAFSPPLTEITVVDVTGCGGL